MRILRSPLPTTTPFTSPCARETWISACARGRGRPGDPGRRLVRRRSVPHRRPRSPHATARSLSVLVLGDDGLCLRPDVHRSRRDVRHQRRRPGCLDRVAAVAGQGTIISKPSAHWDPYGSWLMVTAVADDNTAWLTAGYSAFFDPSTWVPIGVELDPRDPQPGVQVQFVGREDFYARNGRHQLITNVANVLHPPMGGVLALAPAVVVAPHGVCRNRRRRDHRGPRPSRRPVEILLRRRRLHTAVRLKRTNQAPARSVAATSRARRPASSRVVAGPRDPSAGRRCLPELAVARDLTLPQGQGLVARPLPFRAVFFRVGSASFASAGRGRGGSSP